MRKPRTKSEEKIARLERKIERLNGANEALNLRSLELESHRSFLAGSVAGLEKDLAMEQRRTGDLQKQITFLNDQLHEEQRLRKKHWEEATDRTNQAKIRSLQHERTAVVLAMLFLGSEEDLSLLRRLEMFDGVREIAGYTTEELDSVPVDVMNRAFRILTPSMLRLIQREKKVKSDKAGANKKAMEIVITPEDVANFIKSMLGEGSGDKTS